MLSEINAVAGNYAKSLSGWFNSSSTAGDQCLFGFGAAKDRYNFQIMKGTGSDGFRINGWGDNYDWRTGVSTAPYFDGKWHHCAVVYDTVRTLFYLDGVKKAETDKFRFLTASQNKVVMGLEIDTVGWRYNGALDDIRIYSRALTALQVNALYNEK